MVKTIRDFYTESEKCIKLFNTFAEKHSLKGSASADHVCYKCDSKESFEHIRSLFEHESDYVYQSIISKRRIAIIKLKQQLETVLGPIHFLELSDQKPDGSQTNRFDHIEVFPTAFSYEEFVKKFEDSEQVIKVERPHHTTHDIDIGSGFLFRCTEELLIEKIKRSEMI